MLFATPSGSFCHSKWRPGPSISALLVALDQAPGMGRKKSVSKARRAGSGDGRGDGACLPLSSTHLAHFSRQFSFALFPTLFPTKEPSPRLLFLWHISELALKYYLRQGYKYDKILLFQNECLNMLCRTVRGVARL